MKRSLITLVLSAATLPLLGGCTYYRGGHDRHSRHHDRGGYYGGGGYSGGGYGHGGRDRDRYIQYDDGYRSRSGYGW